MRILIYGDSNTWGWAPRPEIAPSQRHPIEESWPSLLQAQLKVRIPSIEIIAEGLSGRTAGLDDPECAYGPITKNGLKSIHGVISSHMPLDYVMIALGTNDVKSIFGRTTLDITLDIMRLASAVMSCSGIKTVYAAPQPIVIAPPPIQQIPPIDWLREVFDESSIEKSKALPDMLGKCCQSLSIPLIDSRQFVSIDGCDGVHLTLDNHRQMSEGVYKQLISILP